jgi:hypothetical protein
MSFFAPQNPGPGGLDELTNAEEAFLTHFAGLTYSEGNVLTISGGNLVWAAPLGGGGGTGTVTSVSVATANGVSGSVATATTTPAITLTLGAITPSSVAAVGTVTGSNLSGTNTGDNSANTTYASDYRAANFVAGTNYVAPNTAIVGATKTKITYDAKGLVTLGADATTADILDSLNKRYVTDANLVTIGNQSGTNTGDNSVNTLYSGLATSKQDTLTLTTTGSSGPATLVGATLNIPQYSGGGTTITTQDEGGTLSSTVTTLNFTGAGVTASGAGATTTINIPGGGAGSTVSGQATVNFGAITQEDSYAVVTVPTASALTASIISITPSGVATADHDADDYQWDNISGYVSNIINATSFDIIGVAPNGSWGQYKFNYTIN